MFEKLRSLEDKYEELSHLLADPKVMEDQREYQKHAKAHAALEDIVNVYRQYNRVLKEEEDARQLLAEEGNPVFKEMVRQELEELVQKKEKLERDLKILLLPQDPNDEKNVIMEIRAGTGGEEAALFAGDLFRMYSRYVESKGWQLEILSDSPTDIGGYKEIIFLVSGKGAYSRLKFESGVHRVQRIPTTESGGRIHTSAATVAVLPEAEEVDIEIDPADLRIDVFCSSGHGGQSVNTTQSAVRITHLPTGMVVSCQDEKSQHKNKDKAMKILRARLLDKAMEEQQDEMAQARKTMVGSGDRSERIRTYNFPQNRVTDHRIGLTLHKLDAVMDGALGEIIEALITTDQAEKLKRVE
jgi:peptide chain release factor 1